MNIESFELVAKMYQARAKAYQDAAHLLQLELLGDDIEKAQRQNVINDLLREARNLSKHAESILHYDTVGEANVG